MKFIIILGKIIINIIYCFIKCFPTRNKITFISRQSNFPSVDMLLIEKKLPKDIEVVKLCKTLDHGIINKIKYLFHMFAQMYHIATSKIVVLDSYCIAISVLKHKKSLIVIQMWHALGAFKKFGKSIINNDSAKSIKNVNASDLSKIMDMHKNYDYIFASSKTAATGFSEAFGYPISKFKIFPMARLDLIIDKNNIKNKREEIYNKYPKLKNKTNILYCPTFRTDNSDFYKINELISKIDYDKYNLILKLHPLTKYDIKSNKAIVDNHFQTYEMGFVSDIIITDYSAVIFELSFLNKPIYFYAYDMRKYINDRDFYLDYKKDMPGLICKNLNELELAIKNNNYDIDKIKKFRKKYITDCKNTYSEDIAVFLKKLIKIKNKI